MNIEAALGRNWKGIAGEIQLTAEQQGEIGSLTSPMDALFNLMAHKKYQLANLINMLKTIERHDVISEITEAGYNSSTQEEPEGQYLFNRHSFIHLFILSFVSSFIYRYMFIFYF